MMPLHAFSNGIRKATDFSGVAGRSEFWWFALILIACWFIIFRLDMILTADQVPIKIIVDEDPNDGIHVVKTIPYDGVSLRGLATLTASLTVAGPLASAARRRLRDAGRPAEYLWNVAFAALVLPAAAWVIVWLAIPSIGYAGIILMLFLACIVAIAVLFTLLELMWQLCLPRTKQVSEQIQ